MLIQALCIKVKKFSKFRRYSYNFKFKLWRKITTFASNTSMKMRLLDVIMQKCLIYLYTRYGPDIRTWDRINTGYLEKSGYRISYQILENWKNIRPFTVYRIFCQISGCIPNIGQYIRQDAEQSALSI